MRMLISTLLASNGVLRVQVLEGSTPLTAAPSPSGEEDLVKQLLGPLAPEHISIIRCVGLNYKTHSEEAHHAPASC